MLNAPSTYVKLEKRSQTFQLLPFIPQIIVNELINGEKDKTYKKKKQLF